MGRNPERQATWAFEAVHRAMPVLIIHHIWHIPTFYLKHRFLQPGGGSKKCLTERQEKFNSYHCRSSYQTWKGVSSDMAVKKAKKKTVKKAAKKKVAKKKK